ncbi:OsmC family protein [Actinocorallia populi]|uniref:OsmC family protein n=1 Tax=Actinocorallia populi TaxID=2079200 RepID=UPI0013004E1D|nr:OsmC family protein [Actinocorallia populi]
MEEIRVIHRDQDAFAIFVRDYLVQVDQPTRSGEESGPTPVELFVAAMAACAAHFACHHLKKEGLPYNGLEMGARYLLGGGSPQRISRLTLTVRPPARLREEDTDAMITAIRDCPVTQSLMVPPELRVQLDDQTRAA